MFTVTFENSEKHKNRIQKYSREKYCYILGKYTYVFVKFFFKGRIIVYAMFGNCIFT